MTQYSCAGTPKEYRIASRKKLPYQEGVIKWHLNNFSEDMTKHEQLIFFHEIANTISHRTYPLKKESTENKEEAYFQIYWIQEDGWAHKDGKRIFKSPYKFREGVLAVCYPREGRKTDGLILMNDAYFYTVKANPEEGKIAAQKVLEHEWMHGYGLDHTKARGDIMRAEYNPNNTWTQDSEKGLMEIMKKQRIEAIEHNAGAKMLIGEIEKNTPQPIPLKEKEKETIYWIIAIIATAIAGIFY